MSNVAVTFMEKLQSQDYAAVTAMLSPETQQAFAVTPIHAILIGRHGDILDFTVLDTVEAEGLHFTTVSATHSKGDAVHNIIVDANGHVLGAQTVSFAFNPMMPPANANHTAEAVTLNADTIWATSGLLTMPHDASADNPVPALLLVAGSGANSMDSSLFDNRPFFDIANYLSDNGIAVLRYNERAHTHPMQFAQLIGANVTMQDEYIYDALSAIEILQADDRISQIFVLGLSMGGFVAPHIAEIAGLDGVIIMNSSPIPMHELWYNQNIQGVKDQVAAGTISEADGEAALANWAVRLEEAERLLQLPVSQLEDVLIFDALPALYVRSIAEVAALPIIARNTDTPVFIVHGERDFQTTAAVDFQAFLGNAILDNEV